MIGEEYKWLQWAREIQALSQTGLHFCQNEFDRQRYNRLVELSAEIMNEYTGLPVDQLVPVFLDQTGYATPKVDVRGAVFRDGKILLVREKVDGAWSMPGGWADVNEKPSRVVEREVWEESGFEVKASKLIGVFEANHDREPVNVFHAFKIVFLCDLLGGEARTSDETTEVQFFDRGALPTFSADRTPPRIVAEAFAHLDQPALSSVFD